MQPLDIHETIAALSGPRLDSYQKFFLPAGDSELYGIYCWNEEVSACLTALINNLEVTMRNAFHREFSQRYGVTAGTKSSDWYNAISLTSLSMEKVQAVTHRRTSGRQVPRNPMPSPDDVVSKLTLGFWKHLLDVEQDIQGNRIDWGNLLTALLLNHGNSQPSYWAKQRRRDTLFARIDLVGDMRNRIAHLEPIWKAGPLIEETRPRRGYVPIVVKPAPGTPLEAIDRLKLVHHRARELLFWLSRHRASDYERSAAYARFVHLTSPAGFDGFRAVSPSS